MKNIIVRFFYLIIIRPLLSIFIGVRFENKKALSKQKQFIIVGNHNSHFDALSIRAALPGNQFRNTFTIAALDYFGTNSFYKKAMKIFFNAILIKREREEGEPSTITILDNYLKQGKSLIMFPEGSRGKPGVMTDFKKGIAVLLKLNPHIHFIPVYLNGFGRVLPKDSKLILPMISKVRFGEPTLATSAEVGLILKQVEMAILKLKPVEEKDFNKFQVEG